MKNAPKINENIEGQNLQDMFYIFAYFVRSIKKKDAYYILSQAADPSILELFGSVDTIIELEEYKKTLNSPERKKALEKYKKK